jgi:AbiV family abortive infection protein
MSSPATTPLYLLKGAVYALEQCGLLLRDANILFRGGSYSNTVVLAAFAREELGRSNILLVLRKEALGGKDVTTEEIQRRCDQHVIKQQRGMLSITMRPTEKSAEAKLLRARMETHPHSPEWQQADAELEKITQKLKKRTPNDRHQSRISALYVQPISDSNDSRRRVSAGANLRGYHVIRSGRLFFLQTSRPSGAMCGKTSHLMPERWVWLSGLAPFSFAGRPTLNYKLDC